MAIHLNITFEQVKDPIKTEMDRLLLILENNVKESEDIRFKVDRPLRGIGLNLIERSYLSYFG